MRKLTVTVKKIISTALVLILGAILCFPAGARQSGNGETVRVAVLNYPNYISMNDAGIVSGYAYEYLEQVKKYTGWVYEYLPMTFSQAQEALTAGTVDIVPGNQYTQERSQKWDYSERDMGEGATVLCVMPGNTKYASNDFSNFGGMRIGALKGSVRIIAMSANAFAEDIKKSLDSGMNAHLAKPVDPSRLYSVIAETVARSKTAGGLLDKTDRG